MGNTMSCLWSGGWDSSFRILHLVLAEHKTVQPFYIYDHRRKSKSFEINAIRNIILDLNTGFPEQAELLFPVRIINKSRLKKDPETKGWFNELNELYQLGIQYEWFSRFARQYKIHNLEVGFTRFPREHIPPFNRLLEANIERVNGVHKLRKDLPVKVLRLLENFTFPLIHLTKAEMGRIAREKGFHELLSKSWYCFQPAPDGLPCGTCKPCQIASVTEYEHRFAPGSHVPLKRFTFSPFRREGILKVS